MAISAKTKNVPICQTFKKIFLIVMRLECTTTFYVNTKVFCRNLCSAKSRKYFLFE